MIGTSMTPCTLDGVRPILGTQWMLLQIGQLAAVAEDVKRVLAAA